MKTFRSKLWPVLGFLVVVSLWVIVSQGRMLFGCETDTAAAATAPTGRSQILHSVGLPDKTCLFACCRIKQTCDLCVFIHIYIYM